MELLHAAPQYIEGIYALKSWIGNNKNITVPLFEITEVELQRLSSLKTPNEVIAVVKQFPGTEPVVKDGICIYLDTVQDPGNLGTIIRIADWFGIKQIICSLGCADVYAPKVVQSTMASISRVGVWYDEDEDWLQKQKTNLYAATLNGKPLKQFSPVTKGVLLIGNESKGLREQIIDAATHQITIPRIGAAESLNAAVATGIILSHLVSNENV
jgi:TrmH family RNA methyltransferase